MRERVQRSVRAAAAATLLLTSGVAHGAWGLKFEVWDGANWSSGIWAAPGDVVKFRFGVYYDPDSPPFITTADGTGTAQAMSRFTGLNQASGFAPVDVLQNVVRTIADGDPALTQISGSTIGTSDAASFGSQSFPGAVPIEPYKEIYTGEVKLGLVYVGRTIEIKSKRFGSGNTPGLTFYNNSSPVNKQTGAPQFPGPGRQDQIATIHVPGSLCPSDFTGDLRVNDEDFVLFVVAYQYLLCSEPAMPARCPADLDGDELVDDLDFLIFLQAYNKLECF